MKKGFIMVSVEMPIERHDEIVKAAKRTGMSLAAYMRQSAYAAAERQNRLATHES